MSKSSGEFLTLDVLIDRGYDPLAYRYFLLNAHYRQQLAFTWEGLEGAASALGRLKRVVLDLRADYVGSEKPIESSLVEFRDAVTDDLNMPRALAAMWGAIKETQATNGEIYATLLAMDGVLGFGFERMEAAELAISEEEIQGLIDERFEARKAKDYARGDAIRDQLAQMGVTLEDTSGGTIWRRA